MDENNDLKGVMNFKPIFILSFFLVATLSYFNCRGGKDTHETANTDQNNEEGVTVTAEVDDEDSVEFVQAGESVQIGGTNLTASTRKLTIQAIEIDDGGVKETEVHSEDLVGSSFEVSKLPLNTFLRIILDDQKGAIIPPILTPTNASSAKIKVLLDGEMTIALKLFDLILKQAKDGDQDASKIVREKSLNVIDLVSTGGAIWEAQKDKTSEIALNSVAADLTTSTKNLVDSLPEISSETFAKIISEANQNTIFATTKVGTPSSSVISHIGVLTLQKKMEEESGGKHVSDLNPGFISVKKLASKQSHALAAFIASQELAADQLQTFAETGEISQETEATLAIKKTENIEKYKANPETIATAKPIEISAEVYQQYMETMTENQNEASPTPTSTATETPTTKMLPAPTSNPTSNPTTTTTSIITPTSIATSSSTTTSVTATSSSTSTTTTDSTPPPPTTP